jgi:hypothetical protein
MLFYAGADVAQGNAVRLRHENYTVGVAHGNSCYIKV